MKELKGNVYYYNSTKKEIVVYNVLSRSNVKENIIYAAKKYTNKDEFGEELRRSLMYRFWSRGEYEILIRAWCGGNGDEEIKIDIYDQIKNNWEVFLDYVWNERNNFFK